MLDPPPLNLPQTPRVHKPSCCSPPPSPRRYRYEKGGQWAPGSKGIALSPDDWHKLCGAADAITAAAQAADERYSLQLRDKRQASRRDPELGGGWAGRPACLPPQALSDAGPHPTQCTALVRVGSPGRCMLPPTPPLPGKEKASTPPPLPCVQVSISQFKGKTYVGVREMYDKGGQLLPTRKGCSMSPAGWGALMAGV